MWMPFAHDTFFFVNATLQIFCERFFFIRAIGAHVL